MKAAVRGSSGPLVVKLAGIAGGIGLYEEEMGAAVAAGFRVLALDLSGDRADDPATGKLGWELYADEIAAAIERAGEPRAVLWGTSFGCLVALAAAARHPSVVRGLLLSHPPDPLRRRRVFVRLFDWAERRAHPDVAVRLAFSLGFLGLTAWEGVMPAMWPRIPSLLRASLEAATPSATVRAKVALLFRDDPVRPLPGLPVEMIVGRWDLAAPPAGARRLAARLPGARITTLGFSGHAGAYSRPRAFRGASVAALRRLTGSPAS